MNVTSFSFGRTVSIKEEALKFVNCQGKSRLEMRPLFWTFFGPFQGLFSFFYNMTTLEKLT